MDRTCASPGFWESLRRLLRRAAAGPVAMPLTAGPVAALTVCRWFDADGGRFEPSEGDEHD